MFHLFDMPCFCRTVPYAMGLVWILHWVDPTTLLFSMIFCKLAQVKWNEAPSCVWPAGLSLTRALNQAHVGTWKRSALHKCMITQYSVDEWKYCEKVKMCVCVCADDFFLSLTHSYHILHHPHSSLVSVPTHNLSRLWISGSVSRGWGAWLFLLIWFSDLSPLRPSQHASSLLLSKSWNVEMTY